MKQSQWALAAVVLAAMVFIVTFAMNYLGEGGKSSSPLVSRQPRREINFFWRKIPEFDPLAPPKPAQGDISKRMVESDMSKRLIEYEMHAPGHQDFWFRNDNAEAVVLGLQKKGCKCTNVELCYLPESEPRRVLADAVGLIGAAGCGAFPSPGAAPRWLFPVVLQALAMPEVQKDVNGPHALMDRTDGVRIPGGAVGWVRLHWKGERIGVQALTADLWMDDPAGFPTRLEADVRIEEPFHVLPALAMGLLHDDALVAGVASDIICWSSTRTSLRLEAKAAQPADYPSADPFRVGQPTRLNAEEMQNLDQQNGGRVLCAYRIPVTLQTAAANAKTPFDLGPFLRRVTVSIPDETGEPKVVTVTGRVRGDVDLSGDENGEINFSIFPGRTGKSMPISLQTDVPGLTLTFDRKRTPEFLNATLGKPEKEGKGQQVWKMKAEVLPGKVTGTFPRRDDPLYDDSAIYLKVVIPGKAPRSMRIAVRGTANQS